jgi:4a-hydroxytetrahydrobiopterin dehydratase
LLFSTYDPASIATPGTAVIGSGAAISAMPTFLIVDVGEFGFVRFRIWRVTGAGLTAFATSAFVFASLVREAAVERRSLFSCKGLGSSWCGDSLIDVVKRRWVVAKLITQDLSRLSMPKLLTPPEIKARLKPLKGWKNEGKFIAKTFEFDKFMEGIAFVNKVARVAEEQEHHPDINIRYTTVKLSIQTHSEGGVTEWDVELAAAIEKMLQNA